jgi:hypothetical protein
MLKNGELLEATERAGYDLLITTDRNLTYQQNLSCRTIGVLVLGAGNWPRIQRAIAAIIEALGRAAVGTFEEVPIP